jgi:APA family basic amino acid/polyamine antiporter
VGWAITLEYGIASAGTARSFGDYLVAIFKSFGLNVPEQLNNWQVGPFVFSPVASMLVVVLTALLLVGVKFSSTINVIITCLNVGALLFFIIAGSILVDTSNWNFDNRGFVPSEQGLFTASTILFFAFLGFDQVRLIDFSTFFLL